MKRVLTILVLVTAGSLFVAVSQSPGDAFAADPTEEYLEVIDVKGDLLESYDGRGDDGSSEGDPDSLTGGLEILEKSDGSESGCSLTGIDGLALEDLWIFIATSILILP